jgi:5'-deoxynucleotidase YfbR-like HD superfamily hydrolase
VNYKRLKLLRNAARVLRCHNARSQHPQTVGEHTFGVLAVLRTVYPEASARLWEAALFHDVPEAVTGDVPAPTKHRFKLLEEALRGVEASVRDEYELEVHITAIEKGVLKYCDYMELALFAIEECDSGNRHMASMARNALKGIASRGLTDVTPAALELYDLVKTTLEQKQYDGEYGAEVTHGSFSEHERE